MFFFCSMSCQPEKRARAEAMLGELAELGLMVAKELAVRVRESEDVGETVALAGAFQKVSRVVRMSLALDFKLDRDAAREAAAQAREARAETMEAETAEADRALARHRRHKDRVRAAVTHLIWRETEDEFESEDLLEELEARLGEEAVAEAFEDTPVETIVRRIIADLGLSGELSPSLSETPAGDKAQRTPELADTG
jgi:hypothetical protein